MPVDVAQLYANGVRLLFLTFVFAPIVPLASILGVVAIVINYWTDKAILLRRNSRPKLLGIDLSDYNLFWLPILVLAYAASNFVVCYHVGNTHLIAPSCVFALSVLFWLVPIRLCLRRKPIEDNVELLEHVLPSYYDEYERNAPYFTEDFARANPVTASQGWARWLELVKAQVGTEEKVEWERRSRVPEKIGGEG